MENYKKNVIIKIINDNDIDNLKSFIQNNDVKTEDYDLLTLAIEKDAPFSFIKIILEKYKSINYIFYESQCKEYGETDGNIEKLEYKPLKIPLFSAIAKNNFELADYLIKYYKADFKIRNFHIFNYFYCDGKENETLLNEKNIIYTLSNKFYFKNDLSDLVYVIIFRDKTFLIKYLKIIFSYTSFSNEIILNLLNLYSNKIEITDNQLLDIIKKDNIINEQYFIVASKNINYEFTKILFQYNILARNELYEYINKYCLVDHVINAYGNKVIEDVLKYEILNFKVVNFEEILLKIINFEKYEIIKSIIYDIIYHPSYKLDDINFQLIFKETCYNDEGLKISYYIIDLIYNHPLFDLNKINLEFIFINIINSSNNKILMNDFIEKLFEYNYDFSLVNFENILKEICYNPYGDEFMEYFLNVVNKYHLCSLEKIDFKAILVDSYKNSEYSNTNISKYLLKLIFNITECNFENIKIELLKQCNPIFICMIINLIIEIGNYDLLKYILENETLKSKIDINIKDFNDNYPIITAFHAATHLAHPHTIDNIKIFKYLLNYGVDINATDTSNNPLFIISLYVQNYLFINSILKQQVQLEKYIINRNNDPIITMIYNDDLKNIQNIYPKTNINDNKSDLYNNYFKGKIGDDVFDYYYLIKNEEMNIERKESYDKSYIEELLKSDNIEEEFNKFISIDDDLNNINKNNDIIDMEINPDTNIIRNKFTPLTVSYLLHKKNIFYYLLDHCDIDEVDSLQYSIMHYAVLKEDVDVVKLLLEKGANINLYQNKNGRGHSAFDIAINIGNNEIFDIFLNSDKVLLNQPNQRKETPIISIIKHPLLELDTKKNWINKLVKKGADINLINVGEYCALSQTVKCHSLPLMKFLVEENDATVDLYDNDNNGPLTFALLEEDNEMIQYLIDHGADVNHTDEEKQTPLEIAIRWGSLSDVKILLENGADANANMLDYNGKDISLLSYALQVHEPDIANYLVKYGADWDYKNSKNETIYDIAYEQVDKDNLEVMKILVDHNIDGFKEKIIWDSLKHDDEDHIAFFKFLIENQIDINIKDKDNNTPLGVAIISKNEELVDYLLKNNADIQNINNQNKNIYDLALNNIGNNKYYENNENNENKKQNNDNINEVKNISNNNNNNNNSDSNNTNNYDKGKIILQKLLNIDIENKLKKK